MLAGCNTQAAPVQPSPTEIAVSPSPTILPTHTPTLPTLTATPLPQNTPIIILQPTVPTSSVTPALLDTSKFPTGPLIILAPGSGSRIVSPLKITAFALPGHDGKLNLQLWGEDSQLMGEKLVNLGTETKWITFESQIPFEITAAGESAVLTLTTNDEFGRRTAVNSIDLVLLQMGDSINESNSLSLQPIVINQPTPNHVISGGTLHIEGYAHPFSTAPLIVQLIKTNGAIVASKQIALKIPTPGNTYSPFKTDLQYSVSVSTPIRLTIFQGNDTDPRVDLDLASQLITLQP